jgi:arylsulfatase A-like enzyme
MMPPKKGFMKGVPSPGREALPVPDQAYAGLTPFDAKDPEAQFPPIAPLRPPEGAPNVLVVLLDDVGFGASSAFGGPCQTPNIEKLAAGGLKYTRFHTTALCSPTRQALLTGRNHHSVGMGSVTELATSAPGQTSVRPNTCAPLPEVLKLNGYSTAQFGKCHEVPVWETSPLGPFDRWPSGGGGFEYFYGFIGGETNQYYPALFEGTTPVEPSKGPEEGYHLTEDLADKAVKWVRQQKALMPDKPFFMYFAPGATHAPHHVPKEWADRYKGRFDKGWDALREETFDRQKKLGVVPHEAELTPRHEEIPSWESMPAGLKPVLSRQMEIYAGFLDHTDHHVGRLLDALRDLQVLNDTLVFIVVGDNGASAEGSLQGTFNEMITLGGFADLETAEFMSSRIAKFGGPEAYNHYAVGWAHALCAPYQWTKQVASHWGGTRNGMVVHWPRGIKARGEMRHQFHHVIDLAPTVLEAAGLPHPLTVHGVAQKPLEGVSLLYSFDEAAAPERHETQYFEMFGNRGIYHKGWTAVTKHRTPWETLESKPPPLDEDRWELYGPDDWTQAKDLAKELPEKLRELQRLWLIEAVKYGVLPVDDRMIVRSNSDVAGRPTLIRGKKQLLFHGMGRLTESSMLNTHNKSFSVTAEVFVPPSGAEGVLIAVGGIIGGWSLYVKEGRPRFCYNFFGLERYTVQGADVLRPGNRQVRVEFAYDGGGPARGGTASLFIDGRKTGEGRVERTEPALFSADETCDVGNEFGSPVTPDYGRRKFTGTVRWVEIDLGADAADADHYLKPEQRLKLAMAIQ